MRLFVLIKLIKQTMGLVVVCSGAYNFIYQLHSLVTRQKEPNEKLIGKKDAENKTAKVPACFFCSSGNRKSGKASCLCGWPRFK